jgi:hypothetical protein
MLVVALLLPSAHADSTDTCDTKQDLAFSHVIQWCGWKRRKRVGGQRANTHIRSSCAHFLAAVYPPFQMEAASSTVVLLFHKLCPIVSPALAVRQWCVQADAHVNCCLCVFKCCMRSPLLQPIGWPVLEV